MLRQIWRKFGIFGVYKKSTNSGWRKRHKTFEMRPPDLAHGRNSCCQRPPCQRGEIAGRIHDLEKKLARYRASLASIDAAIGVFSPELDPGG